MKYIVAGGRDFNNYGLMTLILSRHINPEEDTIISGGARGADELGARYASEYGIPLQIFPAYWDTYGKSAGFIRNAEMGEHADCAIVFWSFEQVWPGRERGRVVVSAHELPKRQMM